ncbi:recombination mediator RecR [Patescibacteria group bacterium]|nr:recombination mediator RecR [Patescibacteria group bacterium]MBU1034387.1 recombination mediator RecR [Patescibacteria group bacterium]MBU1629771.1 recombination mediator RecR [Patescibacteria group bacterium]MBU1907933.1 recombination mediator RecR [Patescibacteria group bacterium]
MFLNPKPIYDAAAEFDNLPGIGPRAALRFAYWLVTQPKEKIRRFAQALLALSEGVTRCSVCGAWSETPICSICSDTKRDKSVLCVVATNQDLRVIEESAAYKGIYHVLGGLLDPIEGVTPETLAISQLTKRLMSSESGISEIILAFDPDVRGDTTALFLIKKLEPLELNVSRLARGLPNGAQLEYADGATVASALANRKNTVN